MSFTQYTPLVGGLPQLFVKTSNSLMCLQDSALSDLTLPSDGSILWGYDIMYVHG